MPSDGDGDAQPATTTPRRPRRNYMNRFVMASLFAAFVLAAIQLLALRTASSSSGRKLDGQQDHLLSLEEPRHKPWRILHRSNATSSSRLGKPPLVSQDYSKGDATTFETQSKAAIKKITNQTRAAGKPALVSQDYSKGDATAFETQSKAAIKKIANKTRVSKEESVEQRAIDPKDESPKLEETVKARGQKASNEKMADGSTVKNAASEDIPKKPLNIVLLYADDMRHDSIGIAGTQIVQTPYIDQLAREGIRFTHNCVTTSVCWISRATLYTGMYLSRHMTTMPFMEDFYKYWNQSWPTLLHDAGYHVGHVGKWHHGDQAPITPSHDFFKAYYGSHVIGDKHITKMNEEDSLEFLQKRPRNKPFVLSTCFFAPHAWDGNDAVWVPQKESMNLYQGINVTLPKSYTEKAWKDMPEFFTDTNEARTRFFQRFKTPEMFQGMIKNYYRMISEIDSTVGRIREELERQGVLNDTLIIFTTDNGFFHGEHLMAGKWYPHEESLRVPLVIKDPRIPKEKSGTINDEFTLNVDLAETILGAAGLKAPSTMQGRDIADLYDTDAEDKSEWRKEFFYEHPVHLKKEIIPASTALVRKDYKYITWPNYKVEQLFDMKEDPMELRDVINRTQHVDVLAGIRKRHKQLADAVGYRETFMTECC